ncbi:MAG: thiamine phosphate synthase, partial [Candidatus Saganbacteria bacterium]|nr:thiamine phosphate synthase [Candidatus Saganbacteria bacterium]
CKRAGVTFIVNDYIDVCLAIDADGVHLGQDDVPVPVARKLLGSGKIIGLSSHSFDQAITGAKSGADYISLGPVFSTPSKPDTKPLGIEVLKKVLKSVKVPVVAIGGINEDNIKVVIAAGAKRVAVIRAAVAAKDPASAVKRMRRIFK